LINLVSNGVKFTEKGQVAIHAGLVSCTESHAVVRFEVRDTGIGISEKLIHQLFEPWTQANQSTFRKYGTFPSLPPLSPYLSLSFPR
jgi:signal transduction histidine kinase